MKKFYLSVFIIGFIFNIAFAAESGPKIEIATGDADIGEMQKGKILDFKVEVKSAGTEDLIIENVYSSCGCLEVTDPRWPSSRLGASGASLEQYSSSEVEKKPEPVIVKPGESIFIAVKLDTNKVTGAFEKQLFIISNDPENKNLAWKIKGIILDSAALLPRSNSIPDEMAGPAQYSSSETAEGSRVEKPAPDGKVVMLFYSAGCDDCKEIKDKFLPGLIEKYGNKMRIEEYNIDNPESFAVLLDLQNKYDKRAKKGFFNPRPPAVFAEGRLLYGVKDIKNKLEGLLRLKSNTTMGVRLP